MTRRQPLADQTSDDVGRSAGGKWDDDAHRPCRVSLRPRDAGHGRQRGSARGQMQKLSSVGKFHIALTASSRNSRLDAQYVNDEL